MLTGRKLLLADDSLTIQKVVSLTFGDEGMEVVAVGSGTEALKQLAQGNAPDIVLADVHMPEPNGYQLCEQIRHDERLRGTPVLLLVGTFEPFNEAEARRVGADDVLTKPFQSIRELVSKVGQLLGGRKAEPTEETAARDEAADAERTAPTLAAPASATQESSAPPSAPWGQATEESAAASQTWTPAPETHAASYNDFDMDDQTIQTTPAEAFGSHVTTSEGESEEMAHEVEAAGDWAQAQTEETSFIVLDEPQPAPAQTEAQSTPELSYAPSGARATEFVPRAPQVSTADDALLDLGEGEGAVRAPVTEADEFILDLDDTFTPAQAATAAAPRVMYAEGLASSPVESAAPLVTEEAPHTDARALEADAQAYEQPPQSGQAVELVLPETLGAEPAQAAEAGTMSEAASAEAPLTEAAEVHEPPTQAAPQPEMSAPAVAVEAGGAVDVESSSAVDVEQSGAVSVEQGGAMQLSPEMVDVIARRVVELMSDKVVREIAWEVVPDLAERLIKQRLEAEHPTGAR